MGGHSGAGPGMPSGGPGYNNAQPSSATETAFVQAPAAPPAFAQFAMTGRPTNQGAAPWGAGMAGPQPQQVMAGRPPAATTPAVLARHDAGGAAALLGGAAFGLQHGIAAYGDGHGTGHAVAQAPLGPAPQGPLAGHQGQQPQHSGSSLYNGNSWVAAGGPEAPPTDQGQGRAGSSGAQGQSVAGSHAGAGERKPVAAGPLISYTATANLDTNTHFSIRIGVHDRVSEAFR